MLAVSCGRLAGHFDRDDVVIVGAGLAAKLGVRVGAAISDRAQGQYQPFGTTPGSRPIMCLGFHIGNTLYDSNYIFMPLKRRSLFQYGDTVSGIG